LKRKPHPGEPAIADSALRDALVAFGFDRSSIHAINPISRRIKNVNFRVRAAGNDWVLKRYRSATEASLEFTHHIETRLEDSGYPVAQLRRTPSGETIVRSGCYSYTLHAWVSGNQITAATRDEYMLEHPALLDELAASIGRLHRTTRTFDVEATWPPPLEVSEILQQPQRILSLVHSGASGRVKQARLYLRPRKSGFDRWIAKTMPELRIQAEQLANTSPLPIVEPDDVIVVHNDINWENLILDESGRLRALLDFDNATVAPRAFEIGAAAVVLAGPDCGRVDAFVEACIEASGLEADRAHVKLGMHLKCVRSISWSINAYLSGQVGNAEFVASWCSHLYDSMVCLSAE
jgi:Ser/Thr protein kinase RdoA (MazF antagonist)